MSPAKKFSKFLVAMKAKLNRPEPSLTFLTLTNPAQNILNHPKAF
jgi:hypothetical protein